eukprot:COSAG01_NODE_8913_length_2616_cov_1.720699_3_plen_180_part_00
MRNRRRPPPGSPTGQRGHSSRVAFSVRACAGADCNIIEAPWLVCVAHDRPIRDIPDTHAAMPGSGADRHAESYPGAPPTPPAPPARCHGQATAPAPAAPPPPPRSIESRWVPQPLGFPGEPRPPRLNHGQRWQSPGTSRPLATAAHPPPPAVRRSRRHAAWKDATAGGQPLRQQQQPPA